MCEIFAECFEVEFFEFSRVIKVGTEWIAFLGILSENIKVELIRPPIASGHAGSDGVTVGRGEVTHHWAFADVGHVVFGLVKN